MKNRSAAKLKLVVPATTRKSGLKKSENGLRARARLKPIRKISKPRKLSARQKEALVLDHRTQARKLARSILRKWHSRIDSQEIDSVVDLSLCEAVKRYDPSFGASFITFLFYHMRGNLIRTVSEAANLNMIAVDDEELETQANDLYFANYQELRSATAAELAQAVGRTEHPLPDALLLKKEVAELSTKAFDKLDTLERSVIERILLNEEQLIDVAQDLGYSRCHISRVKRKALETLHKDLSWSLDLRGSHGPVPENEIELARRSRDVSKEVISSCSAVNVETERVAA
jgi:RNA polymerase sigma factor (sigma-70 family)